MKPSRPEKKLIPSYSRRPLLSALGLSFLVYYGTQLIAGPWPHHVWETAVDRAIPLLPWTVVIYTGAFLFWVAGYILAARLDRANAWRFLAADAVGKVVCFIVFLILPTTVARPEIPADAPFAWALELIYTADAPDNLFPSIHCFNSWLCWVGVRGRREIPAGYRAFSLLMALAVGLSTLTTKQHVVADVFAGFFLAELCWFLAGHTGIGSLYGRLWERSAA